MRLSGSAGDIQPRVIPAAGRVRPQATPVTLSGTEKVMVLLGQGEGHEPEARNLYFSGRTQNVGLVLRRAQPPRHCRGNTVFCGHVVPLLPR